MHHEHGPLEHLRRLVVPPARARRTSLAAALTLGLALGWTALQRLPLLGARPEPPRLVVLYAPCTVNASHLAPYRDEVFFTPHLERFARDALVFERNQSESDQSGTSYAALLTGRQAPGHGVFAHPARLRDDVTTITEAFAAAGWDTFFWAGHGMASARLGYTQGTPAQHVAQKALSADDPVFLGILDRLLREPGYRALVVTSFTVTHYPYKDSIAELRADFPAQTAARLRGLGDETIRRRTLQYQFNLALQKDLPGERARHHLADADVAELARVVELLYDSNVARLDAGFGAVVDEIDRRGLGPRSLVAFTADHGEVLYRENALFPWSHDFQLAPEVLRTPLLVRGAGIPPGRYEGVTRSIDLYPTLAALAGVATHDDGVTGVDLSRAVRGEIEPPDLVAFSHTPKVRSDVVKKGQEQWALFASLYPTTGIGEIWVSLRHGDLVAKLRKKPDGTFTTEVFDLARDPEERHDLFTESDPEHARLAERLVRYKRDLVAAHDAAEARAATPAVSAGQIRDLRALGYLE